MRLGAVVAGCAGLWISGCATQQRAALGAMAHRSSQARRASPAQAPVQVVIYDRSLRVRTVPGIAIASEPTSGGTFSYVLTNAHLLDSTGLVDPRLSVAVKQPDGASYEFNAAPVAVGRVPDLDLALIKVQGVAILEGGGASRMGRPQASSPGQAVGVPWVKVRQFLVLSGFGRFLAASVSEAG